MARPTERTLRFTSLGAVAGTLGAAAVAAGLFSASVSTHLERSCTLGDTPYLQICPEPTKDSGRRNAELRDRIRANPGDSWSWARLLVLTPTKESDGVLQAAAELAPNHPNVIRRRAAAALRANELPEAVALLVQMLQSRGTAHAGEALARLVGSGQAAPLLRPHLPTADRWLPPVLSYMAGLKIPPEAALPVVAEAVEKGTISDLWLRGYLQSLKTAGRWHDAYGLWLIRHRQSVPLLYNADFDQALGAGGFDWESEQAGRSRAGAIVEQRPFTKRGQVLEAEFTGRSFNSPILRQYLFVPPGSYRLQGEYMASKLKSEGGLVWQVVCPVARNTVAARSTPMLDTGSRWKTFELLFIVPPDCGPVASLQLEPTAAFEAAAGIRGRFAFDALSLTRESNRR